MRRSVVMQRMLDEWALGEAANVTFVGKTVDRQNIMHDQDYINWVNCPRPRPRPHSSLSQSPLLTVSCCAAQLSIGLPRS